MGQSNTSLIKTVIEESDEKLLELIAANGEDEKILIDMLRTSRDANSKTVLHWAAIEGKCNFIDYLINNSVFSIDVTDANFNTPLHSAVSSNQYRVIEYLLRCGANFNAQDEFGSTPMHLAILNKSLESVKLLAVCKPNMHCVDNRGCTPLALVNELEDENLANSIRAHLAELLSVIDDNQMLPLINPNSKLNSTSVDAVGTLSNINESSSMNRYFQDFYGSSWHVKLLFLCKLWGLIKYTHPFLLYKSNLDWDGELYEVMNNMVVQDGHIGDEKYFSCLVNMISKLGDANTRLICRQVPVVDWNSSFYGETKTAATNSIGNDYAGVSGMLESNAWQLVRRRESGSFRYSELGRRRVAILELNPYENCSSNKIGSVKDLCALLIEAVQGVTGLVLDLRTWPRKHRNFDVIKRDRRSLYFQSSNCIANILLEAFRVLLKKPLVMSTMRQRIHNGLTSYDERLPKAVGGVFGLAGESMVTGVAACLHPLDSILRQNFNMCFVIDSGVPRQVLQLIMSCQAAGIAHCVYQVEDYLTVRTEDGVHVYEPHVDFQTYDLSPAFEHRMDIELVYRVNEYISSDSSVGFQPDCVLVVDTKSSLDEALVIRECYCSGKPTQLEQCDGSQAAISCALSYVQEKRTVTHLRIKRSLYPQAPTRTTDRSNINHLGLCGLITLWSAIELFYVHRHLIMDSTMDSLFIKHVDRFKHVKSELEYAVCIANLMSRLNDSNSFVMSAQLGYLIGTHTPAVLVRKICDDMVVVHVDQIHVNEGLLVGDIIDSIDGQPITKRCSDLSTLFSHSTQQSLLLQIESKLLAGPQDSKLHLTVKRTINGGSKNSSLNDDKSIIEPVGNQREIERIFNHVELELTRTVPIMYSNPRRHYWSANSSIKILDDLDRDGMRIVYVNLIALPASNYGNVIDQILGYDFGSLIFDMRGYIYGDVDQVISRFISNTVPVSVTKMSSLVPSCMTHEFAPSILVSRQCVTPHRRHCYSEVSRKLVCLINEETTSNSEYGTQIFKFVRNDLILVGKKTNGSVGHLTTLMLPNEVLVGFTSVDITGIDGKSVQGIGIVPDFYVEETLESAVSGEDQFIQKAVQVLQSLKNDSSSLVRKPQKFAHSLHTVQEQIAQ